MAEYELTTEEVESKKYIIYITYNGSTPKASTHTLMRNRIMATYVASENPTMKKKRTMILNNQNFILISFEDLRIENDPGHYEYKQHITRVLTNGIKVNGRLFVFCGHSCSQLRSRSCFLISKDNHVNPSDPIELHLHASAIINAFGNFRNTDNVVEHSRQIGLAFSESENIVFLKSENTVEMSDITRENKNFTDGCGFMSEEFAKHVAEKYWSRVRTLGTNTAYIPDVYHIKYKGYKGVLVVEIESKMKIIAKTDIPKLDVVFRKSMLQFSGCASEELYVTDVARPSTFAMINVEIITLLSSLGIPDEVFINKATEYLHFIRDASESKEAALFFMNYLERFQFTKGLLRSSANWPPAKWIKDGINKAKSDLLISSLALKNPEKFRIGIPKSRNLFGISDHTGKLLENQCMVIYTTDKQSLATETLTGKIMVARSPTYHPSDIVVYDAVCIPELAHLKDCLILPITGRIPPSYKLSGGSIDRDEYFVCWDRELIPPRSSHSHPLDYSIILATPSATIPFQYVGASQYLDRINYFVNYTDTINTTRNLRRLYVRWARSNVNRSFSPQCLWLSVLSSQSVNGRVVQIPDVLLQRIPFQDTPPFILDVLRDNISEILNIDLRVADHHTRVTHFRDLCDRHRRNRNCRCSLCNPQIN